MTIFCEVLAGSAPEHYQPHPDVDVHPWRWGTNLSSLLWPLLLWHHFNPKAAVTWNCCQSKHSTTSVKSTMPVNRTSGGVCGKMTLTGATSPSVVNMGPDLRRFRPICRTSNGVWEIRTKSFLTRLLLSGIIRKQAAVNLILICTLSMAGSHKRKHSTVKGLRQLFPGQVQIYTLDSTKTARCTRCPGTLPRLTRLKSKTSCWCAMS